MLSAVFVYPVLVLSFCFFQGQMFFHEKNLPVDFRYQFKGNFEELWLNTPDGQKLNSLYFKTELPAKGIVVYLHGNSDNLNRWGRHAEDFCKRGYEVLMIDYRGFGKNTGKITEQGLITDGQVAYSFAQSLWPQYNIILYGRSLGSGIAAQVAKTTSPKMLVLETPYTSLPDVAKQFIPIIPFTKLSKYQLNTKAILGQIQSPIHLIHGTSDGLVHFKHSKRLQKANPMAGLSIIPKGKHKNLATFNAYQVALDSLLNIP
jgi:uncharacterized protein